MSYQVKFRLTTAEMCSALKISESSLYILRKKGVLLPGVHYRAQGPGRVRPKLIWDPEAVDAALTQRHDIESFPSNQ